MNVLVTGIDGFVGSHLAEALVLNPEYQVYGTILDQVQPNLPRALQPVIKLVQVDITNFNEFYRALVAARPSKVFHLAGQAFVPLSLEDPATTFRTNIDGTLNVLEAIRRYTRTERQSCSLLVVSSGEVYGSVPVDRLPVDELVPLNPGNPYASSKACADLVAQEYRHSFGLEVVVARPFNHLGPRQSEMFVASAFARQIAEIKQSKREPVLQVGNLDPQRDFTDVRDVVQAYIKILEGPREHEAYNVCSGHAVAIREILSLLCELGNVEVRITTDPARQRRNEIPAVIGSAARLHRETAWLPRIPLRQTLTDLLEYWEDRVKRPQ